jgi:hypothetical protein
MKRGTFSRVLAFIQAVVFVGLLLTAGGTACAESLSSEDKPVYPSTYSVGKGGRVTMFVHASDDLAISGVDPAVFTSGFTVYGFASGEYPDDEDPQIIITKGHISLDRIEIVPDKGYSIDNVMVKEGDAENWSYMGKIATYDFKDDVNAFIVIFRLVAPSQTPAASGSVSDASSPESLPGSSDFGTGNPEEMPLLALWFLASLPFLILISAAMIYIVKHRKVRGKLLK